MKAMAWKIHQKIKQQKYYKIFEENSNLFVIFIFNCKIQPLCYCHFKNLVSYPKLLGDLILVTYGKVFESSSIFDIYII